ncbi:hypothetical protein HC024_08465 [Methylococcaceae bacterium WWC4]|nr:hypothetical protein [Methylococcaceae bacterium WWC4]
MKACPILGVILLLVASSTKADFIYQPFSGNEQNPYWGGFETISIPIAITEDLGNGLFSFFAANSYDCCGFSGINGTLSYENGEVTRWDFTSYRGDARVATYTSVSRFDGTNFFESYTVSDTGSGFPSDGGVVYSSAPGTWTYIDVPPPPPPRIVPIPSSLFLFVLGMVQIGLLRVRRGFSIPIQLAPSLTIGTSRFGF